MPNVTSVAVTPRCCAIAPAASATDAATVTRPIIDLFNLILPRPRCNYNPLACLGIHAVDHRLVLFADELALELHGRRDLVVLWRQLLLDQPELLDRLDPGEALVDALDLPADQLHHLAR